MKREMSYYNTGFAAELKIIQESYTNPKLHNISRFAIVGFKDASDPLRGDNYSKKSLNRLKDPSSHRPALLASEKGAIIAALYRFFRLNLLNIE